MSETQEVAAMTAAEQPAEQTTVADALNQVLDAASEQPTAQPAEETSQERQPSTEAQKAQDDRAAAKFAALSRKERQLRQQEKALKTQQAQISEMQKQIEAFRQEKEAWENEWKSNPLEALKKRGTDYKKLTEEYIMRPEETPEDKTTQYIKSLEAKFEALQKQLEQKEELTKKQQEEAQAKAAEQAKSNYLSELSEFVNKNADKYELIAKNDAIPLLFDVMDSVYKQSIDEETGENLYQTPQDFERLRDLAAAEVEEHLFNEAKKLIETNKLKSLVGTSPKQEPKKSTQPVTLSNTLSQQVPTKNEKFLSDEESKKYAASLIKWTE